MNFGCFAPLPAYPILHCMVTMTASQGNVFVWFWPPSISPEYNNYVQWKRCPKHHDANRLCVAETHSHSQIGWQQQRNWNIISFTESNGDLSARLRLRPNTFISGAEQPAKHATKKIALHYEWDESWIGRYRYGVLFFGRTLCGRRKLVFQRLRGWRARKKCPWNNRKCY